MQTPSAPFVAQYKVTGIVSGLYGTETNSANHQAGDYFVLFDNAVASFPMRPADIAQTFDFVGQTAGQALVDAEAAGVLTLTYQGISAKTLAVSHVELDEETRRAPRDSEGSIYVAPWPRVNAENTGDEYLINYLSDDRSAVVHSETFGEVAEVPALFKSTAKLLSGAGTDKYINVTGNTLSGSGDDAVIGVSGFAQARSLQRILKTGNYVEATLRPGAVSASAGIGLINEGRNWQASDAVGVVDYRVSLTYVPGAPDYYALSVLVAGANIFTLDTAAESERVRIQVTGSVVRFYRYAFGTLFFMCETPVAPSFPLRVWADLRFMQSGFTTSVEQVMLTTRPMPSTAFTADQQTRYYGGLKDPVQVSIYQHSGVREIGYGLPWEGAI
ncbi:MAG: hypothetical protein ABW208_22350 [Pyrinomonadaceae bacterium]